ncbi:hypothetical protein [Arthrobacter sp. UM1]|uniref:hypothetical protein n=1 Tax=Arthrobacter sp. UM1 TaxID=2766776 RepID=UPI001CF61BD0|nr:hypothetical protein [Arthrobacter sp. UM1]MCB4208756.1 hypothetical protein [Arthrobacter sp. UM1]
MSSARSRALCTRWAWPLAVIHAAAVVGVLALARQAPSAGSPAALVLGATALISTILVFTALTRTAGKDRA